MHRQALRFGHGEVPTTVPWDEAIAQQNDQSVTWWFALVNENSAETSRLLLDHFGFHPLAVSDAVTDDARPELKEFEDHLFILAPCLAGKLGEVEDYAAVAIFVKGSTVVTVTPCQTECISRRLDQWAQPKLRPHTETGFLIYSILDSILDDYFPQLDRVEDEVDELADAIMEGSTDRLRPLILLKRRMLEIRRRVGPFRDVLNSLVSRQPEFLTESLSAYYHDLFDNALRLTELIDTNRDALTGLADIHLSTVSNRLNEVMKKMTVIATVLMWASLIAGVYGMNVKIPETSWTYGYPWALGVMAVGSAVILVLFRWQKWL